MRKGVGHDELAPAAAREERDDHAGSAGHGQSFCEPVRRPHPKDPYMDPCTRRAAPPAKGAAETFGVAGRGLRGGRDARRRAREIEDRGSDPCGQRHAEAHVGENGLAMGRRRGVRELGVRAGHSGHEAAGGLVGQRLHAHRDPEHERGAGNGEGGDGGRVDAPVRRGAGRRHRRRERRRQRVGGRVRGGGRGRWPARGPLGQLLLRPLEAPDVGVGSLALLRGQVHGRVELEPLERVVDVRQLLVNDAQVEDEILRRGVERVRGLELADRLTIRTLRVVGARPLEMAAGRLDVGPVRLLGLRGPGTSRCRRREACEKRECAQPPAGTHRRGSYLSLWCQGAT